ncbi:MAG TPA: glycosyltransferase family 2 protein [Labilithrix sp.]|jgi:glycosyltransferase involved in cell wall biosynthesis|nr:glycosyltransferase family 2 protein [Labilithrix sp.]
MGLPTVSAIIPSYNYGHFVTEAVDSVLAQKYEPALEVIVVDDGSKDDTRERLKKYDGKIRYIYQENRGLSGARNTGIRAATGEWIALLDADDLWHPEKTALQMRVAREHEFDVIGSPGKRFMPETLDPNPPVRRFDATDFLTGTHFSSSTTIAQRRCFDVVGFFDETLRSVEDRDMWLRLSARFLVGAIDSPCAMHRAHTGQMSRNAGRMQANFERCLDTFFAAHPQYAEHKGLAYAFMYADAAVAFMESGDRKESLRYMAKSLRYHPWEPEKGRYSLGSVRRLKLMLRTLIGEKLFTKLKGEPQQETALTLTWVEEEQQRRANGAGGQATRSGS